MVRLPVHLNEVVAEVILKVLELSCLNDKHLGYGLLASVDSVSYKICIYIIIPHLSNIGWQYN